ncbi:MAG: hypothetical protein ACHQSE_12380, partial [Gemmatimonadales bacterium]
MDEQTEGAKPAKPWLRNNLVTLGSAAVFSVYSAGYFRTREAADRFAGESVQRHAAAIAAPQGNGNSAPARTEAPPGDRPQLPVMHLSSSPKPHKATAAATHDSAAPTPPSAADTIKRDSATPSPLKLAPVPSSSTSSL